MPSSAEAATPLRFRADVQGLRAVAVLVVVVNHLVPGLLPGGFVGVDVFFVVSGYLITGLLLREHDRAGRISLLDFYGRRARRILPAATVVTVVTVVAAVLTLPLLRVQTILSDATWAVLFAANVRMAQVGTDYFAQGEPPSPLRHYWSLAVEEQFYLVWPLLLVGCSWWVLRSRRGAPAGAAGTATDAAARASFRRHAGALVLALALVSLAWSLWATYASPVTAYYSTFARGWELGVGAACALLPRARLSSRAAQLLAAGGVAAVAVACLAYSARTPFPGAWAALPVLGTAAVLVAGGTERRTVVASLLARGPLVRVGDWSYSIYLWHWPLIVLVRSHVGPARFAEPDLLLGTFALSLVLGWASFRWVETPFRRGTWRSVWRPLAAYPASVALVAVVVLGGGQVVRVQLGGSDAPAISTSDYAATARAGDDRVALVRASVLAAREGRAVPGDLVPGLVDLRRQTASLGECDYRTGTTRLCPLGDPDAERTLVALGDSHARALSPALVRLGEELGYRVHVLVYSGCSAVALQQVDRETGRVWEGCEEFKDWAESTIAELEPDLVVVSTAAGRFLDPATGDPLTGSRDADRYVAALRTGFEEHLERLATLADRVALVGGTPKLPRETGVCLSQGRPDLGECAFAPGPFARREAEASFAAARAAGATAVDAQRWFCADGLCPAVVGRYITMRDSEHMTPDYARWLAPALGDALGLGASRARASRS